MLKNLNRCSRNLFKIWHIFEHSKQKMEDFWFSKLKNNMTSLGRYLYFEFMALQNGPLFLTSSVMQAWNFRKYFEMKFDIYALQKLNPIIPNIPMQYLPLQYKFIVFLNFPDFSLNKFYYVFVFSPFCCQ